MLLVVVVLAAATVLGLLWRSRAGRFVPARAAAPSGRSDASDADGAADAGPGTRDGSLTSDDLGAALGARATFVQLSSAVCAPCRSTAAVLGDVAGSETGVVHVELAAEERLDLVRRFGVLRTPTVLVLDAAGTVRGRFSGATTRAQALDALDRCPGSVAAR